jgi:hypothetical protein
MHQIQGVVDQLGGLFGSHGTSKEGRGVDMARCKRADRGGL